MNYLNCDTYKLTVGYFPMKQLASTLSGVDAIAPKIHTFLSTNLLYVHACYVYNTLTK